MGWLEPSGTGHHITMCQRAASQLSGARVGAVVAKLRGVGALGVTFQARCIWKPWLRQGGIGHARALSPLNSIPPRPDTKHTWVVVSVTWLLNL